MLIFSDDLFDNKQSLNLNNLIQACTKSFIDIKEVIIARNQDYSFAQENDNLIVIAKSNDLSQYISNNLPYIGQQIKIVQGKIVLFRKNDINVIFMPLDCDFELLSEIFKDKNKKYCQFHLFGLKEEEIVRRLDEIKLGGEDFEYRLIFENLLCHMYFSYRGQQNVLDDYQSKIAISFQQNLYSENEFTLEEIVYRLLCLKDRKLSIWESGTKGILHSSLLGYNEEFDNILNKIKIDRLEYDSMDKFYDEVVKFKSELQDDVGLVVQCEKNENLISYKFAIIDGGQILLYKTSFKTNYQQSLKYAKNAILFNLCKKLKQNEQTFTSNAL